MSSKLDKAEINELTFVQAYIAGRMWLMNSRLDFNLTEDDGLDELGVYREELFLLDETSDYWVILHSSDCHTGTYLHMVLKNNDWNYGSGLEMLTVEIDPHFLEHSQIVSWFGKNCQKIADLM